MQKIRCAAAALIMTVLLCLTLPALGEAVKLPVDLSGGMPYSLDNCVAENVYEDESLRIEIWEDMVDKTRVHLARVTIADPSQLRTMSMQGFDKIGRVGAIEVMANRANAVVAFGGDYYCGDAKRFVLRQGTVYKENMGEGLDLLLIDEAGDFNIILAKDHPEEMDKTQVNGKKVVNALCFGPALIKDGQKNTNLDSFPTHCDPEEQHERLAFCQIGPLEYMVVACAHRGLTLPELTDMILMLEPNVQQAYNLDGGISTQLLFLGRRINNTSGEARKLVDIVYFASAYQPD